MTGGRQAHHACRRLIALAYVVWLNGKLVWHGSLQHGYHPDADRFSVTRCKGQSDILVFTNWLFYVSLRQI